MPAKSKAQFRFMQAAAHGGIPGATISKEKAAEYVSGQSPKGLPERLSKLAKARKRKRV